MNQALQNLLAEQTVLVVDDNAINREFLRTVLDDQVAEIRVAQDGPAALEIVRDWRPDLVLMDMHMPGMDGLETWRRMRRELDPAPRAIILTADWRPEERRRLLAAGFDAFLGKPVASGTLIECLRNVVTGRSAGDGSPFIQPTGRADAGPPLLDDQRALAAANQNEALVAQMRTMLLDDLRDAGTRLDQLIAGGEQEQTKAAIHRIKGSCGYAGAAWLQDACGELEQTLDGPRPGAGYLQFARTLELTRIALGRAVSDATEQQVRTAHPTQ